MASFSFSHNWGSHNITVRGDNERGGGVWLVYVVPALGDPMIIPVEAGNMESVVEQTRTYLSRSSPPEYLLKIRGQTLVSSLAP